MVTFNSGWRFTATLTTIRKMDRALAEELIDEVARQGIVFWRSPVIGLCSGHLNCSPMRKRRVCCSFPPLKPALKARMY
jgi:hypothetical protein